MGTADCRPESDTVAFSENVLNRKLNVRKGSLKSNDSLPLPIEGQRRGGGRQVAPVVWRKKQIHSLRVFLMPDLVDIPQDERFILI